MEVVAVSIVSELAIAFMLVVSEAIHVGRLCYRH